VWTPSVTSPRIVVQTGATRTDVVPADRTLPKHIGLASYLKPNGTGGTHHGTHDPSSGPARRLRRHTFGPKMRLVSGASEIESLEARRQPVVHVGNFLRWTMTTRSRSHCTQDEVPRHVHHCKQGGASRKPSPGSSDVALSRFRRRSQMVGGASRFTALATARLRLSRMQIGRLPHPRRHLAPTSFAHRECDHMRSHL
jgi:hypothetical protein